MNFESLVGQINQVHDVLQAQAAHAINLTLTARNWLVGYYIVEYEQHGEDRAKYGEKLLKNLSQSLNRRGFGERRLYEFRQTYLIYPQLGPVIAGYLVKNNNDGILRLPTAKLQLDDCLNDGKLRLSTAKSSGEEWQTPADRLFNRLMRRFYEAWKDNETNSVVASTELQKTGSESDSVRQLQLTSDDSFPITAFLNISFSHHVAIFRYAETYDERKYRFRTA